MDKITHVPITDEGVLGRLYEKIGRLEAKGRKVEVLEVYTVLHVESDITWRGNNRANLLVDGRRKHFWYNDHFECCGGPGDHTRPGTWCQSE
jgi:hypothetical protein